MGEQTQVRQNGAKDRLINLLAGVLLTISLGLGGWALANTSENKTDGAVTKQRVNTIEHMLERIEKKLDRALERP
jgi:hypothetical protein